MPSTTYINRTVNKYRAQYNIHYSNKIIVMHHIDTERTLITAIPTDKITSYTVNSSY